MIITGRERKVQSQGRGLCARGMEHAGESPDDGNAVSRKGEQGYFNAIKALTSVEVRALMTLTDTIEE